MRVRRSHRMGLGNPMNDDLYGMTTADEAIRREIGDLRAVVYDLAEIVSRLQKEVVHQHAQIDILLRDLREDRR